MEYAKSADGSVVEVITTQRKVDVSFLLEEKERLEKLIADCPVLKEKPDEETLDFYNGHIARKISIVDSSKKLLADINAKLEAIAAVK